jgi:hypothetical protein
MMGAAMHCDAAGCLGPPQAEPSANYSWPYLRRTARHRLLTRQLCAASVAPQRNRLFQVIPAERSQYFTAAGRQGASSARLIALAAVAERLKKSRHAATNSFITVSSPHFVADGNHVLSRRRAQKRVRRAKQTSGAGQGRKRRKPDKEKRPRRPRARTIGSSRKPIEHANGRGALTFKPPAKLWVEFSAPDPDPLGAAVEPGGI